MDSVVIQPDSSAQCEFGEGHLVAWAAGPAKEKIVRWNPFESCLVRGGWEQKRKFQLRGER
jgi:hypothetical protein